MSRRLALRILLEVESGRRLDVAWEACGARDSEHRAWLRALAYGTVRLQGRLDHLLAGLVSRPLSSLDPAVRVMLRLGAFQILEMDSVPAYAAVSETVELAKRTESRAAAGLVNAVLRRAVRAGRTAHEAFPDPGADLEGHLATWGSHPRWLVRRWLERYGAEGARALVEANNREPETWLRPVGVSVAEARRMLAAAGIVRGAPAPGSPRMDPGEGRELPGAGSAGRRAGRTAARSRALSREPAMTAPSDHRQGTERRAAQRGCVPARTPPGACPRPVGQVGRSGPAGMRRRSNAAGASPTDSLAPRSIRLPRGTNPAAALAVVPAVVQDPAASLVVDYAAPPPDALVADVCAAPGGKALALTDLVRRVVALDLSPRRMLRVQDGARRTGARVWRVVADARRPPLRAAQMVLVDAPCSGTGTFRRRPDGRWRLKEGDVARLARIQQEILIGAAAAVPRGGILVYATCALEPEENGEQARRFLAARPDFRIEPAAAAARYVGSDGCLAVLPHHSGFDGAFAARMRRT